MTESRSSSRPFVIATLVAIGLLVASVLCWAAKVHWVGFATPAISSRDFYVVRRDGKLIAQDEFTTEQIAQCRTYASVASQSLAVGRAPGTHWNPRLVYEFGSLVLPRSTQITPDEMSSLTLLVLAERDKHANRLGIDLTKASRNPVIRGWESWSYEEADRRMLAWRMLDLASTIFLTGSGMAGMVAAYFRWLQLRYVEGTCRSCGYPLQGIRTTTCPECGRIDA